MPVSDDVEKTEGEERRRESCRGEVMEVCSPTAPMVWSGSNGSTDGSGITKGRAPEEDRPSVALAAASSLGALNCGLASNLVLVAPLSRSSRACRNTKYIAPDEGVTPHKALGCAG